MKHLVVGMLVLGLSGCAATAKPTATANNAKQEQAFASALSEAFDAYEREVQVASALTYSSEAEARAVALSLSDDRFDFQLEQALVRRGLTLSGLSKYAAEHPEFFHAQQAAYWGRLEGLGHTVDTFAARARLSESEVVALTADLGE